MARLWRRQTHEIGAGANPGLRLLPAMLVGVVVAALLAYFAIGLHPSRQMVMPEIEFHAAGTELRLPDGTACNVAHHGCDLALAAMPRARVRVVAEPGTLFAVAVPALELAAHNHVEALIDDGTGPVELRPQTGAMLAAWAHSKKDAAALRPRVIMRADGIWIGSTDGKVLGSDPRGPSILPTATGQNFSMLRQKLRELHRQLPTAGETCALLPALDCKVSDVVRAATVVHGTFSHVLLAVP